MDTKGKIKAEQQIDDEDTEREQALDDDYDDDDDNDGGREQADDDDDNHTNKIVAKKKGKQQCMYCEVTLSCRSNLVRHMMTAHDVDIKNVRRKTRDTTVCAVCHKTLHCRGYGRHMRNVHNIGHEFPLGQLQQQATSEPTDEMQTIVKKDEPPLPENLLQILPTSNYQYSTLTYDEVDSSTNSFKCSFTVNINDLAQFAEWRKCFQERTRTQYTILATKPCVKAKNVLYKQYLKCLHHKVHKEVKRPRNHTACPARLTMTIRRRPRLVAVIDKLPCRIDLIWCHNHAILAGHILRHHKVAPATDEKLIDLYNHGHSPNTALECLKADIEDGMEDDEMLDIALVDRSICPDIHHCNYLFERIFERKYGKPKDALRLGEFVALLNNEHGEGTVLMEEYDLHNLIAICTPLMKRIHERIEEAGDVVFVDSSVCFDPRDKYKVFLLSANSKAGVIPLAVGISSSESLESLTRLFHLIKQVLPDNAFFGRGRDQGPQLVMMNDSVTEQGAIQNVWPGTGRLLSQFNVLQTTWQYLVLKDNNISVTDQPGLFALVKNMMYAPTHLDLSIQEYISALYERKGRLWCSVFREGLLVKEASHASNDVESQFKRLKDQIFKRSSRFNIVQMTHFITDRLSSYYERRLLDYSCNRQSHVYQSRKMSVNAGQRIDTLSEDVFEIESCDDPSVSYTVNIATCMCSCTDGAQGKVCKHVHNVQALTDFNCSSRCSERDDDTREVMYFVACGCEPPAGWLDKIRDNSEQLSATAHFNEVPTDSLDNTSLEMHVDVPDIFNDTSVVTIDTVEPDFYNDASFASVDDDEDDEQDCKSDLSVVSNTDVIIKQLIAAKEECKEVFQSVLNSHTEGNPVEVLAAYRSAIDRLKLIRTADATVDMLKTLGKQPDVKRKYKKRRYIPK